jgi:hypothetical protein
VFSSKELKLQSITFLISGIYSICDTDLVPMITYTSIAVFVSVTSKALRPSYIVLVMSYYMIITFGVGFYFIRALSFLIGAFVSVNRIQV